MTPPARLAPAPRDAIRRSLLAKGLIEPAALEQPDENTAWTVNGAPEHYRLTEAGLRAAAGTTDGCAPAEAPTTARHAPEAHEAALLAQEPPTTAAEALPALPARQRLRAAAEAVFAAWDDAEARQARLPDAIAALRTTLDGKPSRPPRDPAQPRKLREGTKQQQVLAMLRRPKGATVAQIAEATGWQVHTVRGFLAGLKKRQGIAVEAAERVRQVGPGKEGAQGSYTVYRIAEAG
ncbi:DUF3489 domain-containing protein [Belnapia sp. F-4-1]|uniref:DUF3489 domain-containing protein n=1 Tax=Belnapia sp. F-4-1 TaxID=1545443 RepID=UPI00191778F6|nr:DUF3489 domain-containing protein [Belnapia sp. F-4-1]